MSMYNNIYYIYKNIKHIRFGLKNLIDNMNIGYLQVMITKGQYPLNFWTVA